MTTEVEWCRGAIVTREAGRAVMSTRYTNIGVVIELGPRQRWARWTLELVLAAIAVAIVLAAMARLPRPIAFTVIVAWLAARFTVATAFPSLATTIVVDDEHLAVHRSQVLSRVTLLRREDIAAVVADGARVVAVDRRGVRVPVIARGVSATTAQTIAAVLDGCVRAPQ